MTGDALIQARLALAQRVALVGGAVALAAALVIGLFNGPPFLQGYLMGFMLWIGLPLGAAALLMVHHLSGGRWGWPIRRTLEAAATTLPLFALLFLPLLAGLRSLYPWTADDGAPAGPVALFRHLYLSEWFFVVRAAAYFGVWFAVGWFLARWSRRYDDHPEPAAPPRLRRLSAAGLVLYVLTVTFASIDWVGSLQAHWYSTIYGLYIVVGQALSALAAMIALLLLVGRHAEPPAGPQVTDRLPDLSNLLLAIVVLFAYMAYSQFFIIWNGNLPNEISWYAPRVHGAWGAVAALLLVFHFFAPFSALLFRRLKRHPRPLLVIALVILGARVLDTAWMVMPSFDDAGALSGVTAAAATAGIGGVWVAAFIRQWRRGPLCLAVPEAVEEGRP